MIIEIPRWNSHYNQLLYSLLVYTEKRGIDLKVRYNPHIPISAAVLQTRNKTCFLDYSDDPALCTDPMHYDAYFKRSLLPEDQSDRVFPLNFQVNFSYKPLKLLSKMPQSILTDKRSRVEIIRAVDLLKVLTNDSHFSKQIKHFPSQINDNNGRVIFMTRLWSPYQNHGPDENRRRMMQNEFRVGACKIIKAHFPNSKVGLLPDAFSASVPGAILLEQKEVAKRAYLRELMRADICIADDGLKDTPGWKIGEYTLFKKAIISTPIPTVVSNFKPGVHYLSATSRAAYDEIPDMINTLLKDKFYMEMKANNAQWSAAHLDPERYVENILRQADALY